MKSFLLIFVALAPALFADEFFTATASYKIEGKIPGFLLFEKFSNKNLLSAAAQANSLRVAQVALVFDTTTDSLVIIKKSDGTILDTVLTVSGGQTIASDDDGERIRYANAAFNGGVSPTGTIAGDISIKRNASSLVTKFAWGATFQGTTAFDTGTSAGTVTGIIRGTFLSGKRFTPGS